jgi:hypothetical protein
VWPTLIGMHAHLDKGHIVTRTENPDGSFAGALQSTIEDRTQRWTARGCQTAHGIRTSLMSTVSLRSAQLIDAETDARAWAERFDRDTHLKPPISLVCARLKCRRSEAAGPRRDARPPAARST